MNSSLLLRTPSFLCRSPAVLGGSDSGADASTIHRCCSAMFCPQPRSSAAASLLSCPERMTSEAHLLRRARSEADITGSSRKTTAIRLEEEERQEQDIMTVHISVSMWSRTPVTAVEDVWYSGGGIGKGGKKGGSEGKGGGGGGDNQNNDERVKDYYEKMLRSDPSNPLLLRNYGKFLHEVVGDLKGAEEYYGRAILASPADGEVISLYAKLLWETCRDGERADAYFKRAIEASPEDCYLRGSYAQFLWDAKDQLEEEEEEEEKERERAAEGIEYQKSCCTSSNVA